MGIMGPKFFGFFVRYEKWEDNGIFLHSGMQLASLIEDVIGSTEFKLIDSDVEYADFEISGVAYSIHAKRPNDIAKASNAIIKSAKLERFEVTPLLGSNAQTVFGR